MSLTPLPLMVFAAGFGTRMGALTADRPKPLIEVAGKHLIDRALDLAAEIAPDPIVVNLHYRADQLVDHLKTRDVLFSREEPEILDTGGGMRAALPLLGEGPVASLNPDVIWRGPNPLAALIEAWQPEEMDALLMCIPIGRIIGRVEPGDFDVDAHGHVTRGGDLVYGGAQIIKTDMLHDIPETAFSLNMVWSRMIAQNRLCIAQYPGFWCDVGRPEGIAMAEELLARKDV